MAKLWSVFLATSDLVTDKQVRRLFALVRVEGSLETAAAKAGMDAKAVGRAIIRNRKGLGSKRAN